MMIPQFVLFLILLLTSSTSYAYTAQIKVWQHTLGTPNIIQNTLLHALEITTKEYGDYQIIESSMMTQDRALKEINIGNLDIAHFIATAQREEKGIAVRIPVMRGLLGYRICLIKNGEQDKFDKITNKEQWLANNITIGQQENWPDTEILKSNEFNVKTTFKKELLFQQIAKGRFDCFARGANEITRELLENKDLDISIENGIVIYYPFPLFYFVNPNKPLLAERLTLGLTRLHENGMEEKLFDSYFHDVLEKLTLKQRHLLKLDNPILSEPTINAMNTYPMLKE